MTIADRIRNRRLELGLSVDDLAALLNKNRTNRVTSEHQSDNLQDCNLKPDKKRDATKM